MTSSKRREAPSNILQFNAKTTTRTVDDPYSTTGGKLTVTASVRNDTIGRMYARLQIEQHQFEVCRYLQGCIERAEGGRLRSIDWRREPVDGRGPPADPITGAQRKASKELEKAKSIIGTNGFAMVRAVLVESQSITNLAAAEGITKQHDINSLGFMFRRYLEILARHFGFAGQGPRAAMPHDKHSERADDLLAAIDAASGLAKAA
jgi:hypothetical protein